MQDFIEFKNAKINFGVLGKGDTIVLLHGFTESMNIWNHFSEQLSKTHQVVCIDLPGHGNSDCVNEIHTMELMAECVKAVLNHLNIEKSVMIGHSMGGYVTLSFAEKFPEHLSGMGLFHSSALPDNAEGKANRLKVVEFIKTNHIGFIMQFIPDLFAPEHRERLKSEIKELVEEGSRMTKESIIASQLGMRDRKDQCEILRKLKVPILFIAGKQDTRVPFDKVIEQIALPKDCVAVLLEDVAHMGYMEAREKTLYAVKTFVDGCF
ncbi:MAG: alpha/beta hydrolase [Bacteroidetes bacterium]|nr:alpha/beta hydrolase [Bacteroidota bacterium]